MATRKKPASGFGNENEEAVLPIEEEVQENQLKNVILVGENEPQEVYVKGFESEVIPEPLPEPLPEIVPTEMPELKHQAPVETVPEAAPAVQRLPQKPSRRRNIPRFSRLSK